MRRTAATLLLSCCVAALAQQPPSQAPSSVQPPASQKLTSADVVALEQSLWQVLIAGDADALDKIMLPDFVDIAGVINTRADLLETLKHKTGACSNQGFTIDRSFANVLSDDVATIAYQLTTSKVCGERTSKIVSNMTSVWVRHDGRWQLHLHTERAYSGFSFQSQ